MRGTTSRAAFEIFREGVRARSNPFTQERWQASHDFFKKAIEKDTGLSFAEARAKRVGYPRAWSWMAYGLALSYFEGWQSASPLKDVEEFSDLALALDEFDYHNHWVAAFVHLLTGNTKRVEEHMNESLDLNEEDSNMNVLNEMADVLVWLGRPDEAVKLLDRGRRTTDWNRWSMAWSFYFMAKDNPAYYDRALKEISRTFWKPGQEQYERDIQLLVAAIYAQKAALLEQEGRSSEAAVALKYSQAAKSVFDAERSGWTIADEMRRMPFANTEAGKASRDHWQDGLSRIGLAAK